MHIENKGYGNCTVLHTCTRTHTIWGYCIVETEPGVNLRYVYEIIVNSPLYIVEEGVCSMVITGLDKIEESHWSLDFQIGVAGSAWLDELGTFNVFVDGIVTLLARVGSVGE